MEKYRKAYKAIQNVYDNCVDGVENEKAHYEFARKRLQGLQLVAAADANLTDKEWKEIDSWKIRRITDEAHQ